MPQRFYGVEARGAHSRVQAEDQAHGGRDAEGHGDRIPGDERVPFGVDRYHARDDESEDHADQPSDETDCQGLDQELLPDVAAARAEAPADADLARALQNVGEHDVHDADAADQQRDAGDAAHDDVEDALRALVLFEQLARDNDRIIVGLAVRVREHLADQDRGRFERVDVLEAQRDLVKLRFKALQLEFLERRRERDVDVVAEILQLDAFELVLRQVVVGEHADDREPHLVDLEGLADGRLGAEEFLFDARADHAELFVILLVRFGDQAAFGEVVPGEPEIGRGDADDVGVVALALEREDLKSLDAFAGGIGLEVGRDRRDRLHVAHREADRILADFLEVFVFEFAVLDDDVAQAHRVDDAQALLFGARADRKHGDHRADAEDHPEHGQKRTQLVRVQVAEGQIDFS